MKKPMPFPLLSNILPILFAGLLLTGCSSHYRAVPEGDLSELEAQLESTDQAIHELNSEQKATRDLLYTAERESTQRLLTAIKEQMKAHACPAPRNIVSHCETQAAPHPVPPPRRASAISEGKLVIGEIENVYIDPPGAVYKARIDTGAATASLDARDIQTFERDGEDWVRFKMPLPGREELIDVERKVSHFVRILQSSTEDGERRPVIKMRITIGTVERLAEFTLSDRGHLEFPVLIGRNVLRDTMLVDVSRDFSVPLPENLRNGDAAE